MSKSWAGKNCVLYLDRTWRPFTVRTPEDTFVKMTGEHKNSRVLPILIEYERLPNGDYDFEKVMNIQPLSVEEWMRMTPRPYDRVFNTINRSVVIPSVCVTEQYSHKAFEDKVVKRVSKSRIGAASGYVCAYTGKYVPGKLGNVDHIIPKSRGGGDTLENLVWSSIEVNSMKANRTPEEAGLPEPKRLTSTEYNTQIRNNYKIKDWEFFLKK